MKSRRSTQIFPEGFSEPIHTVVHEKNASYAVLLCESDRKSLFQKGLGHGQTGDSTANDENAKRRVWRSHLCARYSNVEKEMRNVTLLIGIRLK